MRALTLSGLWLALSCHHDAPAGAAAEGSSDSSTGGAGAGSSTAGDAPATDDDATDSSTGGAANDDEGSCDPRFSVDAPSLSTRWRRVDPSRWTLGERTYGAAVAVDASAAAYSVGYVLLGADFPERDDAVVNAWSPTGDAAWNDRYQGMADLRDRMSDATIDAAGDLIVAGTEETQLVDWGDGRLSAKYDTAVVVLAYAPDGTRRWRQQLPNPEDRWVDDVQLAARGTGGLVVVYTSTAPGEWKRLEIAELAATGVVASQHVHSLEAYRGIDRPAVAIEPGGRMYIALHGQPWAELDDHLVTLALDAHVSQTWARAHPSDEPAPYGVVADAEGVVVLASQRSSPDDTVLHPWLRRYDRDGEIAWTLALESRFGGVIPRAVGRDCRDELVVLGQHGTGPWIGRVSADGELLDEQTLRELPDDRYRDLALDPAGNLVLTGQTCSDVATCRLVTLALAR